MSETDVRKIRVLLENMASQTTYVEERLKHAGMEVDPLLTRSIAKYWDALEKLAAE